MAAYKLIVLKDGNPIVAAFTTRPAAIAARETFREWGALAEVIFDATWDCDAEMDARNLHSGQFVNEAADA